MTDEEVRRIRRIIAGPAPAPAPVEPRQAERFQRALGAVRRPVVAAPLPPSTTPASPSAAAAATAQSATTLDMALGLADEPRGAERRDAFSAGSSAGSSAKGAAASASSGSARPRRPVTAVAAAHSREADEPALDGPVVPTPLPFPAVHWTAPTPGWDSALVETVALLCRSSDPAFHSWTVQVPLDPETLPHTELRLTFSPHHLQLRFLTQSTRSLHLVSSHLDALHALMRDALPDARHIDIDIT